uniref:Uncharacterized protein n=1 Tax=Acrobeloides nanus TaxID=290746 RepID=A0A914DXY7_9BILA
MKVFITFCLLFVFISGISAFGTLQSVAARGKLLCNGQPYKDAKIKLYDVDGLLDDFMAETKSDRLGVFYIKGNETEITTIDPKINIYHNCNDEAVECLRKFSITIPDDYITEGPEPAKTFDAAILNLSGQFPGETRDCIN